MNEKRLRIYLEDHLALMVGERELAERCRGSNQNNEVGDYLKLLISQLVDQEHQLQEVLRQVAQAETVESKLKQGAAWFAEKLGRFKLNDSLLSYSSLSRVVELEALAAAAHERVALWDNLAAMAESEPVLESFDFVTRRNLAEQHFRALNERRRGAAVEAFRGN